MYAGGMPTVIRFDSEKIEVTETPQEIRDAILAAGTANVPMIEVTDKKGAKVHVNAHRITTINERGEYRAASFQ